LAQRTQDEGVQGDSCPHRVGYGDFKARTGRDGASYRQGSGQHRDAETKQSLTFLKLIKLKVTLQLDPLTRTVQRQEHRYRNSWLHLAIQPSLDATTLQLLRAELAQISFRRSESLGQL
jgi:hypothetical protein